MPAIQPARLKLQTAELLDKAADPQVFTRAALALLEQYSDRTYRPGQVGEEPPLLPAFFVPKPVLREILKELRSFAVAHRDAALHLADALWAQPYFESHYLAACLLGLIPPNPPEVILKRVEAWTKPPTEIRLVEILAMDGLARVRTELPDDHLLAIKTWLASRDIALCRLGLKCLLSVVSSPSFEDLPSIFKLLTPPMREAPAALRPYLSEVVVSLVRRSPHETAYYLSQNLVFETQDLNTRWIIRRSLKYFPLELQTDLAKRAGRG